MALKTGKPAEASSAPAPAQTTVLELALYERYTWNGVTYEKGHPYRFRNEDAMLLISEQDTGRPLWKLYTPIRPRQQVAHPIVDATGVKATKPVDEFAPKIIEGLPEPRKRIDIGDDSEIADILGEIASDGDVTV